ncbi:MAG TPA: DUF3305 domain-containing protein [Burkholderiales bacterium]|nr:DUF3305 domain-containing protein [Burkholderiales bacterium]
MEIKYLSASAVAPRARQAHNGRMADKESTSRLAPYALAVVMERARSDHRWASERWEAKGVVRDHSPAGSSERIIVNEATLMQVLFPGFMLRLHPDEAEGYLYNVTSPQPKVFVMWRIRDDIARPERLTVSYHEGARWLDAEEGVGGVALPPDLVPWIAEFARQNLRPEPVRKKRYASSKDKGVASHRDGTS